VDGTQLGHEGRPRGCKYCDGDGSIISRASDRMQPATAEDMTRMFPHGVYTMGWVEDGIGRRMRSVFDPEATI